MMRCGGGGQIGSCGQCQPSSLLCSNLLRGSRSCAVGACRVAFHVGAQYIARYLRTKGVILVNPAMKIAAVGTSGTYPRVQGAVYSSDFAVSMVHVVHVDTRQVEV